MAGLAGHDRRHQMSGGGERVAQTCRARRDTLARKSDGHFLMALNRSFF
jgi:hypothetical protein